jgi:O-methyltransferase
MVGRASPIPRAREEQRFGSPLLQTERYAKTNAKASGSTAGQSSFLLWCRNKFPSVLPDRLALLRLDTDWYESTKHELIHLFPLLESRGLLILDDYGFWEGVRKATDAYFSEHKLNLYPHRVDNSCRMAVRTDT